MAEKGPMARMQLLLPPDLKAETDRFARELYLSANEAIPVSVLVDELGYRVRDLEQRLAKQEGAGA